MVLHDIRGVRWYAAAYGYLIPFLLYPLLYGMTWRYCMPLFRPLRGADGAILGQGMPTYYDLSCVAWRAAEEELRSRFQKGTCPAVGRPGGAQSRVLGKWAGSVIAPLCEINNLAEKSNFSRREAPNRGGAGGAGRTVLWPLNRLIVLWFYRAGWCCPSPQRRVWVTGHRRVTGFSVCYLGLILLFLLLFYLKR